MTPTSAPSTFFTVGHSTRPIGEFVELLQEAGVRHLLDVRHYPGSRRYPQFSREALRKAVEREGVSYQHEPALGGRREPRPDSPNRAWRNEGFRGYADHLATAEFQQALELLESEGSAEPTAVMCAEAVPWRCHRRLIADSLVARGHEVVHLIRPGERTLHALDAHARKGPDGTLRYPSPRDAQSELFTLDDHAP